MDGIESLIAMDATDLDVRSPHMAMFMAINNALFALDYPGDGIGPKAISLTIESLDRDGWALTRKEPG